MKNRIKKICTSLLAAMMIFTYMPAMAFADTGNVEWFDNYASFKYEGQTYDTVDVKTDDSTCAKEGKTTYTAMVNGQAVGTHEETIAKKPHTEEVVDKNVVEPTCVDDGSKDEVTQCSVCGEVLKTEHKVLPKTGVHTNEEFEEVTKAATCKEDGSKDIVVKCTVCGKEESRTSEVIPKSDAYHVWDEGTVTKEATCGAEGEKTFKCTLCDATKVEPIEATGKHNFVEKLEEEIPATCEEDGAAIRTLVCDVCGAVKEDSEEEVVLPALGHDWDEGKVTKQPTDPNSCEETGVKTFTCKTCKATKEENFGAKEHTIKTEIVAEFKANCSHDGYRVKHSWCTECDKDFGTEFVDFEPANGQHVWEDFSDEDVIVEPTCTKPGKIAAEDVYCDVCEANYKEENPDADYYEIPALGHDTEDVEAVVENNVPATCTKLGSYDKVIYCDRCEEEVSRTTVTTAALGHDWDNGKVTKAATCTADGVKTFTCKTCKETRTEAIPATGHDLDEENAVITPPTCAKDGVKLIKCKTCGEVIREDIPALGIGIEGHEIAEVVQQNVHPAKCNADGWYDEVTFCAKGEEVSRVRKVIPASEDLHVWVATDKKTEPVACSADGAGVEGSQEYKCSVCGKTKVEPLSPHDFQKVESMSSDATCEKAGKLYEKCSVCGKVEETDLPALGHKYEKTAAKVHWSADTPGKGFVTYTLTCANDPSHQKTENVDFAFGDEDKDYQVLVTTVKPECEKDGSNTYTFVETLKTGVISDSLGKKEVLKATGHDTELVKRNVLEPTCTKEGKYDLVPKCKVCGKEFPEQAESKTEPALGHVEDENIVWNPAPTFDKAGKYEVYCKVCGELIKTVDVPATEHTPGEFVTEVDFFNQPTCTKEGKGFRVLYCACKDEDGDPLHRPVELSREEVTIPATGHTPKTYEGEDYDTVECEVCGEVLEIVVNTEDFDAENAAKVEAAAEALKEALNAEPYDKVAVRNAEKALDEALEEAWDAYYEAGEQAAEEKKAAAAVAENRIHEADALPLDTYSEADAKAIKDAKDALAVAVASDKTSAEDIKTATAVLENAVETAKVNKAAEDAKKDAAKVSAENKYTDSSVKAVAEAAAAVDAAKTTAEKKAATEALNKAVSEAKLKAANTLTAKGKTLKAKAAKTKKFGKIKAFKVSKAKGKVTFKKVSGDKRITVSKAGKVTVKKGLKKGKTYTIKVKVTAAGNGDYLKGSKTVKLKVKVK